MKTMTKAKAIWSATALLMVSIALAPGALADHKNCDGDVWGWKRVQESCEYDCDDGDTVFVVAQQEDDDKSTSTKGEAACNSAWADCTGTDSCSARGVTIAAQDDHGFCLGTFYSSYWTDGHVYCGAGDGVDFDSPVQVDNVVDVAVEAILGPDGLSFLNEVIQAPGAQLTLGDRVNAMRTSEGSASCSAMMDQDNHAFQEAGLSSFQAIVLHDGTVSGISWNAVEGCMDVEPHCVTSLDADIDGLMRTCSI